MKPAGLYPPLLANVFVSTILLALLTCLERFKSVGEASGGDKRGRAPPEESKLDLLESFRFCSSCNSRIASSILEVMLNRSAVRSRFVTLLVYAPCRTWRSGFGWRRARLRPLAVRTTGSGDRVHGEDLVRVVDVFVDRVFLFETAVAEDAAGGRGRGMLDGTN